MVNMPNALSHSMPSPDFDANMDDLVGKAFAKLLNFEEQEAEGPEANLTMGSVGSLGHATGDCKPCAWFHKPGGCANAYNCTFCHLCKEGELKKRKKEKRKQAFSRASTTDTLDSTDSQPDTTEDWSEAVLTKAQAGGSTMGEPWPLGSPELSALDGASPLIEALKPLLASVHLLQTYSEASQAVQLDEALEPQKPQKPEGYSSDQVLENLQSAELAGQDRPLAPQTVTVEVVDRIQQVYWAVSASTLISRDRSAVSPSFELYVQGRPMKFKLMLFPKESSQGRGGSCFKKAKGKGYIQLKCETQDQDMACPLSVRFFAGGQALRGPVANDFRQTTVKGLPKEIEMWDLEKCVNNDGFVVGAEITAQHAP